MREANKMDKMVDLSTDTNNNGKIITLSIKGAKEFNYLKEFPEKTALQYRGKEERYYCIIRGRLIEALELYRSGNTKRRDTKKNRSQKNALFWDEEEF